MALKRVDFFLSFVLAISPLSSIAQYRCEDGGRTVYQQHPCPNGKKVDTSGAGQADLNSAAAVAARADVARMKRADAVRQAISDGRVGVGMTADEVVDSWGRPSKINRTITRAGTSEQWIYRRGGSGRDQYVYLENGVVRTIQSPDE